MVGSDAGKGRRRVPRAFPRIKRLRRADDRRHVAAVEDATLIEQPRAVDRGVVAAATQPNWEMAGVLALKVAVVDGLGIEQSYASSRVEIKRSISERASVEAKDDFARTIINDLIAASSTELENSINQNLADRRAP
jgi:hypothetical protein